MKHIMKSTLALVLVLSILLVPMTATAATGAFNDKYILSTTGTLTVDVPAETSVYVQATNANGSTVTATANASLANKIQYCTQLVPASGNTATFSMIAERDWFEIYNSGMTAIRVELTLTAGEAQDTTGSMDNPEVLVLEDPYDLGMEMAVAQKTLEAGNQGYWYKVIAPGEGVINVSVSACDEEYNDVGWQFCANNETQGIYGDNHWSDDEPVVYDEKVAVKPGDVVTVFAVTYNPASMFSAPAGIVTVVVSFSAIGSYDCPVDAELGENTASIENGAGYYYTWTAPQDGVATFTMNTATDWEYRVNGIPVDPEDYAGYYYGDTHWSDDVPVVKTESIEMKAGEKLDIYVNTYSTTGAAGSGNIEWTLSFEAGEVGDDEGGEDIGGEEDDETEENYIISDQLLELGTNMYVTDMSYPYTVYGFAPEETGKYTFTIEDGVMGIVSYTDMWVQNTPSEDNVNATTFEWVCTSVGQGIYVAVMADTSIATITVEREELVETETVPWIYYENTVKPEAFVFEGNFDEMMYVDTFDEVEDQAVLGADGYYHLNDATGPILYVCLNDVLMNLADAVNYGQLKEVLVDEEGNITERTDFNAAFSEIFACADPDTGLYPLTVDLIEMYTRIGAYQMWYGENGFIGGDLADAWMFACYYNEGESFEGGVNGDANDGGASDSDNGATNSPNTADVSVSTTVLFVAVLALGVVVMASAAKKSRFFN